MLSFRKIVRGVLTRFLPTAAFLMAVGLTPLILSGVKFSPLAPWVVALELLGAATGYGLTLTLLRRKLSADTPVNSRPSVVAGVVAPIAILLALMVKGSPSTLVGVATTSAIAGALLGFGMFFPWLARPADASDGSVDQAELPEPVPDFANVRDNVAISSARKP